jgi:hypothetical protein
MRKPMTTANYSPALFSPALLICLWYCFYCYVLQSKLLWLHIAWSVFQRLYDRWHALGVFVYWSVTEPFSVHTLTALFDLRTAFLPWFLGRLVLSMG